MFAAGYPDGAEHGHGRAHGIVGSGLDLQETMEELDLESL